MTTNDVLMVRVYLSESDQGKRKRLMQEILTLLQDRHAVQGVTVFRAIAGFGASGEVRADDILRLNVDLPIVIEFFDEPKVAEAFRTGKGVGWHDHSKCLFSGTERFFRPGYNANLVPNWIPALDGVEARLKAGAKVADVGCGHGASTIVMAKAYPSSSALIIICPRLNERRSSHRRPASATALRSLRPTPRIFPRKATTSSLSLIVCTTWGIPSVRAST